MKIVLHIERLVLDAELVAKDRAAHIRTALEQTLMDRLTAPGAAEALARMGAVASVPRVSLPGRDERDGSLGERVGAAVATSMGLDAAGRS